MAGASIKSGNQVGPKLTLLCTIIDICLPLSQEKDFPHGLSLLKIIIENKLENSDGNYSYPHVYAKGTAYLYELLLLTINPQDAVAFI